MNAKHGWWCGTKTYPLTCKHCGEAIFHFSCDCGSSVLFDKLGPPWPQHHCAERAPKPILSRLGGDLSGSMVSFVSEENVKGLARLVEESIDRGYSDAIAKAVKRGTAQPNKQVWITKQVPRHLNEVATAEGVIAELIRDADIHKKARVSIGTIGGAMLGRFGKIPVSQITIHTGALAENESDNRSFTFFVDARLVDEQKIFKGCLVIAKLRGIGAASRHPIWVCNQLTELQ